MPIGLTLITAPVEEPVSLAEAKARLRVTIDDDDSALEAMIAEARAQAEAECGRAFVTQTWSLFLDAFPAGREIRIPRSPLQSVTWVKYYDGDGVQQTLSTSAYWVSTAGPVGRVMLAQNSAWPATQFGRPEAVEIRFVAGYGARVALPPEVKAAVLLMLGERYCGGGDTATPAAARRVLDTLETGEIR